MQESVPWRETAEAAAVEDFVSQRQLPPNPAGIPLQRRGHERWKETGAMQRGPRWMLVLDCGWVAPPGRHLGAQRPASMSRRSAQEGLQLVFWRSHCVLML